MKIKDISTIVCDHFEIDERSVLTGSSKKEVVKVRQIICYFAKQFEVATLEKIGEFFNKDHSTVHYAIKKVHGFIEVDKQYSLDIKKIERKLLNLDEVTEKNDNFERQEISKLIELISKLELRIEKLESKSKK